MKSIKLDGEVADIFKGIDIDTAGKLLDIAVRARRQKGATITICREMIRRYSAEDNRTIIGFGGNANGK